MAEIDWTFIIWTLAVFVAGYLLGARVHGSPVAPLDFDRSTISAVARQRIEDALARDAKIDAIRILRADTGLGLKDAKSVIDSWRQDEPESGF